MKTRHEKKVEGMPALELIEEATALLKNAGAALLIYYLFTLPFVIALLFYWAEMSGSATARESVSIGALGLALLFVLMKTGQARFTCALRERLAPGLDDAWTPRRWIRCVLIQGIWQPSGVIVLPVAAAVIVPFPFIYAFYQSLLLTGSGTNRWGEAAKKAGKLATAWPRQNAKTITILTLFAFVVYINGWALVAMAPGLIKMFFGVESVFTSTGYTPANTTFLLASAAVAYPILDPLLKCVYVLRCFYVESRQSGADLQADLKRAFARPVFAIALTLVLIGTPDNSEAKERPIEGRSGQPAAAVPPPVLDDTIKDVLNRREYRWRLPPAPGTEKLEEKGVLSQFIDDFLNGLKSFVRKVTDFIDEIKRKISDFLDNLFNKGKKGEPAEPKPIAPSGMGGGFEWLSSARILAWVLLIAVCAVLAVFLFRYFRNRQVGRVSAQVYTGVVKPPDLEDEQLLASELPEDEWLRLGDEMLRRGEKRLALRAYYLAVIARLSSREFVTVAPHKTNRDYAREVRRRARGHEEIIGSFGTVMSVFERVWYGNHAADEETWNEFESNRRVIFVPVEVPAHA